MLVLSLHCQKYGPRHREPARTILACPGKRSNLGRTNLLGSMALPAFPPFHAFLAHSYPGTCYLSQTDPCLAEGVKRLRNLILDPKYLLSRYYSYAMTNGVRAVIPGILDPSLHSG